MLRKRNKPDLNAPRFRGDIYTIGINDVLPLIREQYPEYNKLSAPQINKIIKSFNDHLWMHATYNRDGISLPENLGHIFLGTCPQPSSKKPINAALSNNLGVDVSHQNFDSDNFLMKIFYTNYDKKYRFKMADIWGFSACRVFKRTASKAYKENFKKYLQVDSFTRISDIYTRHNRKFIAMKLHQDPDVLYNEFELS